MFFATVGVSVQSSMKEDPNNCAYMFSERAQGETKTGRMRELLKHNETRTVPSVLCLKNIGKDATACFLAPSNTGDSNGQHALTLGQASIQP